MKKLLLLLITLKLYALPIIPHETEQLVIVSAKELNATTAMLYTYEKHPSGWQQVFMPISVNVGRKGMAWAESSQNGHLKYEGDGKAPAGLFSFVYFFGYENHDFNFPYHQVDSLDICVDDTDSIDYNRLIRTETRTQYQSYEEMRRKDDLYKLGIVIDYNAQQHHKRGSCIFMHIQKSKGSPTAGCTSMPEADLLLLMRWLDPIKNPKLLQGPEDYVQKVFTP